MTMILFILHYGLFKVDYDGYGIIHHLTNIDNMGMEKVIPSYEAFFYIQ